ncbi:MAG: PDR/VanB family oxidoreductase [Elusimicrobiota bacterium]|jgi:vanillate O-demethylase ferredoxin subunit
MKTIPIRVVALDTIADGVRLLTLEARGDERLPSWEPGSHVDLHLAPDVIRQYSLCGPCADTKTYQVAVKLEPQSRGGSRHVHEVLHVGSELEISRPRNLFPMQQSSPHSVLLAGGIGITPIISMARALKAQNQTFELLYFTRSEAHAAFRDELVDGDLQQCCRLVCGSDGKAVREMLEKVLSKRPAGAHMYLCGPQPFMEAVQEVASRCGWPDKSVHLEYFSAAEKEMADPAKAFELKLERSGITLTVPAGKTIIDALREQGIEVETSCEQGICGTCIASVLDGTPEHHDHFLTEQEKARGDCIALCVSRSRSNVLVLDV